MADNNKKINVSSEQIKANIKAINDYNNSLRESKLILIDELDIQERIKKETEIEANNKLLAIERERLIIAAKNEGVKIDKDTKRTLKDIETTQKSIVKELRTESLLRKTLTESFKVYKQEALKIIPFLMQSDKTIRNTVLNLGLSGTKANELRLTFEQSAGIVARLGGGLEDIQKIQEAYTEETGKANVLTAEMVKNTFLIGKGTSLGVEGASRLVGQFDIIGRSAKDTTQFVQNIVDVSERMGINSNKVLKNISDNFKRLNTYNFQQGSKGFAQMAMYAEKMKINMNDALNSADIAKSLEGAIDLTAQLQVMGGEFAKTDPFEMLFLSRNDPAKFTEKIADMTKGIVSFRKNADGTFEKFISPADRDRLAAVAKSMGMEASALTEIAQRQADIQRMRKQMSGMNLTENEKKLIEGAAKFNTETGKYEVSLAGKMHDISSLTKEQAESFAKQSVSLEKRAEANQTFEDVLKSTIMELKVTLLPILQTVNKVLVWVRETITPFMDKLTSGSNAWLKVVGAFAGVTIIWKGITIGLQSAASKLGSAITSKINLGSKVKTSSKLTETVEDGIKNNGGNANAGKGMLRGGAGIGAAALGIGAGIGAAAVGISKLADSMSKLNTEQLAALPKVIYSLAAAFFAFTPAIIAVSTASTAGSFLV